jgi:hypothetical protein
MHRRSKLTTASNRVCIHGKQHDIGQIITPFVEETVSSARSLRTQACSLSFVIR